MIFVQGDLNSRTVFDHHEIGSQAKDVLLEVLKRVGIADSRWQSSSFIVVVVVAAAPPNLSSQTTWKILMAEVLKDAALMAAMTSDLQLPKGRWHEASWCT